MGDEGRSREARFLLAAMKLALVMAVVAVWVLVAHGEVPTWLFYLVGTGVGVGGFDWAVRGTLFDPHAGRDSKTRQDE